MQLKERRKTDIIEYLRGFASIYVVIHHFFGFSDIKQVVPGIIHFPFRFGQEMVMLFFLMSGFVIYISNKKIEDIGFGKYFKKRFLRIYPIFFLTLILSTIILKINNDKLLQGDIKDLVGNIFMLQDTGNKPGAIVYPFLKNYPLWSLSYEWWFYMVFFPLSVFFSRYKSSVKSFDIYSILFISTVSWIAYLIWPNHILLIFSKLVIWWCGVYIAKLFCSEEGISFRTLIPVYISLTAMTILSLIPAIGSVISKEYAFNYNDYPWIDFRHFVVALLIIFFGNYLYCQNKINLNRVFRPFVKLAPISYAMYCIHFPIILLELDFVNNIYLVFAIKLLLIILISYLFELIIQPGINSAFKRKMSGKI